MDINFPLILVLAVFVSGIIWLIDIVFLAKSRRAQIASVQAQFDSITLVGDAGEQAKEDALANAAKEPVAVEYAKSFFPVLAIVLVLRSFLVEPFQIPSGSMIPTLKVGDFILVNKFTYGIRLPVVRTKVLDINQPERGEVMVFFPPHKPDTYYIKRIVGLPGDEIKYINNQLFINGERQDEELLEQIPAVNPTHLLTLEDLGGVKHPVRKQVNPGRLSRYGHWVVPEGHYFMIGDNRDNSSDSRDWGPVSEEAIVGKAFAIWMHWPELFSVPSFKRVGTIE